MKTATWIISTSSTADLSKECMEERDIRYIPFIYTIGDHEYKDDLGQTISPARFYEMIEKEGAMPTTSQINVQTYVDTFRPWLKDGKDIVHIELSSGISGSAQALMVAKDMLAEEFPERKLYFHDSLAASAGLGLLVTMAADMRDAGKTAEEVDAWIAENKMRLQHWFYTTDLTHLRRGGRVSAASALVGGMLNICPLMHVDAQGKLTPVDKVRGKKNVIKQAFKKMEEYAEDRNGYTGKCFISHSAREEEARELADMIEQAFPNLSEPVRIFNIGAVIGAHTGPGTVALFFLGDAR